MKLEKIVTWLDQTLNVAAFDPPNAAAPGNAVVDDEKLRAGFRRGLYRLHACIHCKRHQLHFGPLTSDL